MNPGISLPGFFLSTFCAFAVQALVYIIHFYKQRIKTKPYITLQNKTLGVPSNKLAENIPILRLKVEGKKVEGNVLQP